MAIPISETESTQTSNPPPISITVTPPAPLPHIQNVHHHISEKLTQENYILWQFLTVALKDLGRLNFFLGVEAAWHPDGLHLSQQRYIHDLLTKTNMLLAKPISTPLSASTTLSRFEGSTITDPTSYRSTVGSLQYLSLTRPDIAFAVNKVSQFMQDPRDSHWSAVKHILRYLKSTISHTFCIHKNSSKQLTAYSDSDWASCPDDRRSTSGYCVLLGKNILSWSSKKQPTVSRSSTESEYKAIANAAVELTWIQTLLHELGLTSPTQPVLYCDNIGATYLASNPIYHARTKHIEIDYHFVRDMVAKKILQVCFISGKDQLVDILTKSLAAARFNMLRSNLNVQLPTSSLRGRIGLDNVENLSIGLDNVEDLSASDNIEVSELE
jgi:hypothetical protein